MALGNAIYFKGSWEAKFNSQATRLHSFQLADGSSVQTLFMTSQRDQFISAYNGFKVLKLKYEQGQDWRHFSFYMFLPDTPNGLPGLAMKLSVASNFFNKHIPVERVRVRNFRIPKFKIRMGYQFSEALKGLGLELPFKMTGDFSEMLDSQDASNYCVSQIVSTCSVEINEQGTEAADVRISNARPGRIDFVADHPFMFFIREDRTSDVYLVGQLLNPLLDA